MGLMYSPFGIPVHMLLLFLITLVHGTPVSETRVTVSGLVAAPVPYFKPSNEFVCPAYGNFSKPGSCKDFYQCDGVSSQGLIPTLLSCPPGTIFAIEVSSCQPLSHPVSDECTKKINLEISIGHGTEPHIRQQRFPFALVFAGLSALGSLASAGAGIARTVMASKRSGSSAFDLGSIENRLNGIDAKLKNINVEVLESQVETRLNNEISQNLIFKGIQESKLNFELIADLQEQEILENRLNAAVTQGLISQGIQANRLNFDKVYANIGKLKQMLGQEINKTKAEIHQGFGSIATSVDQLRVEPLVSRLLTTLRGFRDKINLIQTLPEENKRDEIRRGGGFIDYLESSTLQETLYDIINQNFAIPKYRSDSTSVFILDLLVQGLQVHTSMMSSIVSSNVYLAGKYLEERNVMGFNTYMLRVSNAASRMKSVLGDGFTEGFILDVKSMLHKVRELPFVNQIHGLPKLLMEKESDIMALALEVEHFLIANTPLSNPGQINGKPVFPNTFSTIPVGPWRTGTKVSYALQTVSDNSLSVIGRWSRPFEITDKAYPVIQIPSAQGVKRLVYRRFNIERMELVAIVTEPGSVTVKDIGRDLLNAASNLNEAIAIQEVQALLENGADVNFTLENYLNSLHYAAKHGNVEVMKLLTNASINIHAKSMDNEQPIHFAALYGDGEGVSYLVSEGAFINGQTRSFGWAPLHIAVANNHVNATQVLLDNNAFINIKDNKGLTALHLSILGNGETLDLLLNHENLDVNAKAYEDLTPLHYAVKQSNLYITRRLLQHKDIEVDVLTADRLSPLHYAAMSGHAEIILELINHGAAVPLTDSFGSTPLHYAAFYGNTDAAIVLDEIDHSLRSIKNKEGKTALNLATETNREDIIKLLRNETEYLINKIKEEIALAQANQTANNVIGNTDLPMADYVVLEDINCTQEIIKELIILSEETCLNVGHITNYVDAVMTRIPISVQYNAPEEFQHIIEWYNIGLQSAKRNAITWRNQNSLFLAIQKAFVLAKDFETTFNNKLSAIQIRLAHVTLNTNEDAIIAEANKKIEKLDLDIRKTTEALQKSTNLQSELIIEFLEDTLRSKQEEMDYQKHVISMNPTITRKLREFLDFLNFVKNDASKVKEHATYIKLGVITFRDQLEEAKTHFKASLESVQSSLRNLQRKSISTNVELQTIYQQKEQLQLEIDNLKGEMSKLADETLEIYKNMRVKRRELLKKLGKLTALKYIGAILTPFGIGLPLLAIANAGEKQIINEWQDTIEKNKEATKRLEEDAKLKEQLVSRLLGSISNDSSNSEILKKELSTLSKLDFDLRIIEKDLPAQTPSISVVLSGIEKIEEVYGIIDQKLDTLRKTGESAITTEEKEAALNSFISGLSEIQCYWKDLNLLMMDIRQCTDMFV